MFESNGANIGEPVPAAAAQSGERRNARRHTLLIRSAKLLVDGAEYLVVMCDASETGAKVRFFHSLPEITDVTLELQNEDQLKAEMVWRKGDKAGLCFEHRTQMARILSMRNEFKKRPVRVRIQTPGILIADDTQIPCTMIDVSQQGAKIICDGPLALRQSVKFKATDYPFEILAKVCWKKKGRFGLAFQTVYQFFELARLVNVLQGGEADQPGFTNP